MAEQGNIFSRLGRLFRSNIIVRQTPAGNLRVKDVDFARTALTSNFIDRYNRLFQGYKSNHWGTKYAARANKRNAYEAMRIEYTSGR